MGMLRDLILGNICYLGQYLDCCIGMDIHM